MVASHASLNVSQCALIERFFILLQRIRAVDRHLVCPLIRVRRDDPGNNQISIRFIRLFGKKPYNNIMFIQQLPYIRVCGTYILPALVMAHMSSFWFVAYTGK